jgi:hypothetical protein
MPKKIEVAMVPYLWSLQSASHSGHFVPCTVWITWALEQSPKWYLRKMSIKLFEKWIRFKLAHWQRQLLCKSLSLISCSVQQAVRHTLASKDACDMSVI